VGEIVLYGQSSENFNCYRSIGNYQMYEVLDDTAAQTIIAIESVKRQS